MFFLGAGFMLLESKGVVHMALLFGSTWVVNAVVFGAILVMILLSNLFVSLAASTDTVALLLTSRHGVGRQHPFTAIRIPWSGGPNAHRHLMRRDVHTDLLRRSDFHGGFPG